MMQQLKMLNDKITLALFIFLIIVGCSDRAKKEKVDNDEVQKLESEVLYKKIEDFHDEVMPEMGKLYELEKQLKSKMEGLGGEMVDSCLLYTSDAADD